VGLQTLGLGFELSVTVELYVTFEFDFALELYLSLPWGTFAHHVCDSEHFFSDRDAIETRSALFAGLQELTD